MELEIVKYLNRFGFGRIDYFTDFFSNEIFLTVLWTVVTLLFVFFDKKHGKKIFWMVIVALTLHFLVSEGLIKNILSDSFFRERPYVTDACITPIGKAYSDSSFPSSHMSSTLSVLFVFGYYYRRYWFILGIFVCLMAFSRVHNGMHYPSDVLAGALFGMVFGTVSICIVRGAYEHCRRENRSVIFKRKK